MQLVCGSEVFHLQAVDVSYPLVLQAIEEMKAREKAK